MEKAIEYLYVTFKNYKANPNMEGSALYGNEVLKWNKELFSKELNQLTSEDLSRFCRKVLLTWGNIEDYKHFLPRVYELISQFDTPYEEWILFDKLNRGSWRTWPDDEKTAIENYFICLWRKMLNMNSGKVFFDDYFAAISNVYPNFEELLNIWENDLNEFSIERLIDYYYDNYKVLVIKKNLPGWKKSKELGIKFNNWLTSDSLIHKLRCALKGKYSPEIIGKLNWIIQELENSRDCKKL